MKNRLFFYMTVFILLSAAFLRIHALDEIPEDMNTWSKQGLALTKSSGAATVAGIGMKNEESKKTSATTDAVVSRESTEPQPGTSITVLSPNGGEYFVAGDTMRIQWTADTDSVNDVMIWLLLDGGLREVLITSQFSVMTHDKEWGDYPWVIPPEAMHDTVSLVTGKAAIRLHQYRDTHFEDYSDTFFTIGEEVAVCDESVTAMWSPITKGEFSLRWSRNTVTVSGLPGSRTATLRILDMSGRILGTAVTGGSKAVITLLSSHRTGMVLLHVSSDEWDMTRKGIIR